MLIVRRRIGVHVYGVAFGLAFAVLMGGASIFSRWGLEYESFDLLLLTSLAVSAPIFLGIGLLTGGLESVPTAGVKFAAIGALLGSVLGRSCYMLGIKYVGPGKALSISSTSPLYAAVLSAVVLDETITLFVGVGTVALIVGVVGIAQDAREETKRGGYSLAVVAFPAIAAVLLGTSVIFRKFALETGLTPVAAAAVNMSVGLAVVFPVVAAKRQRELLSLDPTPLKQFFVASLLMTVAFLFYFTGLRITDASVFYPLVQTQPLFAVVLSALFLSQYEIITRRTLAAALAVVVGATLVVLG